MKRHIAVALIGLSLLSATAASPAKACEEGNEDPITFSFLLPVRLTALASGITIGAPISTIRAIPKQSASAWDTMTGPANDDNVAARLFTLPPSLLIGSVAGVAEGIKTGTTNALDNFYNRPFSAESFSLKTVSD